jgi:hypothetical protein
MHPHCLGHIVTVLHHNQSKSETGEGKSGDTYLCEISGSHSFEYEFRVFWDVVPCSHVEVDRRFRGAYCLHHQGDSSMEAVRTFETSVHFNVTARRYIPEDSTVLNCLEH